jgi:hypothetical protein
MRYVVPQFIDVEDKIIGPITVRQFLILLVTAMIIFLAYKMFDFTLFILVGLFELALGGILAFFRVNGQPFHFFLLNLVQTFKRPQLRVWDKEFSDAELHEFITAPPPPPPVKRIVKEPLAATKLGELSLVVNTGGVYNPEAE